MTFFSFIFYLYISESVCWFPLNIPVVVLIKIALKLFQFLLHDYGIVLYWDFLWLLLYIFHRNLAHCFLGIFCYIFVILLGTALHSRRWATESKQGFICICSGSPVLALGSYRNNGSLCQKGWGSLIVPPIFMSSGRFKYD